MKLNEIQNHWSDDEWEAIQDYVLGRSFTIMDLAYNDVPTSTYMALLSNLRNTGKMALVGYNLTISGEPPPFDITEAMNLTIRGKARIDADFLYHLPKMIRFNLAIGGSYIDDVPALIQYLQGNKQRGVVSIKWNLSDLSMDDAIDILTLPCDVGLSIIVNGRNSTIVKDEKRLSIKTNGEPALEFDSVFELQDWLVGNQTWSNIGGYEQ